MIRVRSDDTGQRIDSLVRVEASVASEHGFPLTWARHTLIGFEHAEGYGRVHRLRPVAAEVTVGATEEHVRLAAAELASGILNQFGMTCGLRRYRT